MTTLQQALSDACSAVGVEMPRRRLMPGKWVRSDTKGRHGKDDERDTPHKIEALISNTASQDGPEVEISLPQDPAQAGKWQAASLIKMLAGYTARATPEGGDKETRFGPFSAQCEAGNVDVLRGAWNEEWFMNLEGFPEAVHDDDADSTSRAFNTLALNPQSTVAMFLSKRHR